MSYSEFQSQIDINQTYKSVCQICVYIFVCVYGGGQRRVVYPCATCFLWQVCTSREVGGKMESETRWKMNPEGPEMCLLILVAYNKYKYHHWALVQ